MAGERPERKTKLQVLADVGRMDARKSQEKGASIAVVEETGQNEQEEKLLSAHLAAEANWKTLVSLTKS